MRWRAAVPWIAASQTIALAWLIFAWLGTASRGDRPDGEMLPRPRGVGSAQPAATVAAGAAERPSAAATAVADPAPAAAAATDWRYDPGDPVGLIVHGVVRGPDGAPVRFAALAFEPEGGGGHVAAEQAIDAGAYAVLGLRPGRYSVSCTAADMRRESRVVELRRDRQHTQIDFDLEPEQRAEIWIVDADGTPWTPTWEALGTAAPPDHSRVPLWAYVAHDAPDAHADPSGPRAGDVDRTLEPAGRLGIARALEPLPLHVVLFLGDHVVASQRWDADVDALRVRVTPDDLSRLLAAPTVAVADATGQPIADALVRWHLLGRRVDRRTDADGIVRVPTTTAGITWMEVEAEGYGTWWDAVEFERGATQRIAVELRAERDVRGRVRSAAGEDVPFARVEALVLDPPPRSPAARQPIRAWDARDGRFTATLDARRYALHALRRTPDGTEVGAVMVDGDAADRDVEIALQPAFRVLLRSRGTRYVLALDASGAPFSWAACSGVRGLWLPRGRWTLDVATARGPIGRLTVVVDGIRPSEVELP